MLVLILIVSIVAGVRRGFLPTLFQYVGMVFGIYVAALLLPALGEHLPVPHESRPPLIALGLIGLAIMGFGIGQFAGSWLRHLVTGMHNEGLPGRAAGGVISLVATAVILWFLALSFAAGPSGLVAGAIQHSLLVREATSVAPDPPGPLGKLQSYIGSAACVFSGCIEPLLDSPLEPDPASAHTPGVAAAAASTVLVRSQAPACGGQITGSGFPILTPGLIITNAHVVTGSTQTEVIAPNNGRHLARVVFFDPRNDVAILDTTRGSGGLRLPPLRLVNGQRGTEGAIIGYPHGGPEMVAAAVINLTVNSSGHDIYNRDSVNREIYVLRTEVEPGDSGGPVVNIDGAVVGMVFASSASTSGQAYALTNRQIEAALSTFDPAATRPLAPVQYAGCLKN